MAAIEMLLEFSPLRLQVYRHSISLHVCSTQRVKHFDMYLSPKTTLLGGKTLVLINHKEIMF